MQIRIEGSDLPGRSCGPGPDYPDGHHNIHVAVQGRKGQQDLLGLVPADTSLTSWQLDCVVVSPPPAVDLRGPQIHGSPAGERLVDRSPEAAAQALEDISRVAHRAQDEIGALVTLLTPHDDDLPSLALLTHRPVAAAAATGLDVTCRVDATTRVPPGDISHVAHRVIQERVTNALRHAAGAPIRITVREDAAHLHVVCNGRLRPPAPVADNTGGYGLQGMRDRVARCRGTLDAGPLPGGGWQVHARLPLPQRGHQTAWWFSLRPAGPGEVLPSSRPSAPTNGWTNGEVRSGVALEGCLSSPAAEAINVFQRCGETATGRRPDRHS